ncbi:unnamed protein product [Acanthosepion pharaonis]|uniref:Uncharacterized protein n=1 Tax=Acanthosepion pharaonis TaxID=158019 RepID=A0A812E4V8_ACAPH|nr:unnamed protein product [Sepia pharaonis]
MAAENSRNDVFCCYICLEDFKEPKALIPCLHTFCCRCLQNHINSREEEINSRGTFSCPSCRGRVIPPSSSVQLSGWAKTFPTNFFVGSGMSPRKSQWSEFETCKSCRRRGQGNRKATSWCKSCNESLCPACNLEHKIFPRPPDSKHETVSLSQAVIWQASAATSTCPIHTGEDLNIFCASCSKMVCCGCFIDTHSSCKVVLTDRARRQLNVSLQNRKSEMDELANMVQSQLEKLTQHKEGTLNEVRISTEEMIKILLEKAATAVSEAEHEFEEQQDNLNKLLAQTRQISSYLGDRIVQIKKSNETTTDPDVCTLSGEIFTSTELKIPSLQCMRLMPRIHPNPSFLRGFKEMSKYEICRTIMEEENVPYKENQMKHYRTVTWTHDSIPNKISTFECRSIVKRKDGSRLDNLVVIPKKFIVVSDRHSGALKKFGFDGQMLEEFELHSPPHGICLWANYEVVVTLPENKQICFVKCNGCIEIRKNLKTLKSYESVASPDYCRLVCSINYYTLCVDILVFKDDNEIQNVQTVDLDLETGILEGGLWYMTVTQQMNILIVGNRLKCLYCFDKEGQMKFTYRGSGEHALEHPEDVTTDNSFIYVTDSDRNRVLRFTMNGDFESVLLTAKDGLANPGGIHISPLGEVVVSELKPSMKLHVFQL